MSFLGAYPSRDSCLDRWDGRLAGEKSLCVCVDPGGSKKGWMGVSGQKVRLPTSDMDFPRGCCAADTGTGMLLDCSFSLLLLHGLVLFMFVSSVISQVGEGMRSEMRRE